MAKYLGRIVALAVPRAMRAAIVSAMAENIEAADPQDAERARAILAVEEMTPEDVRALHAWFAQAMAEIEADESTDDAPSALRAAYALLGGAEGRDFAEKAVAEMDGAVEDVAAMEARSLGRIQARGKIGRISAVDQDGFTEIVISGEIWSGGSVEDFAEKLLAAEGGAVQLRISSPGGDVMAALAIFNMLRAHPGEVVARIESEAQSAASFLAMAADRVEIVDNASMMVHCASGWGEGGADQIREYADRIDELDAMMARAYARGDESKVAEFVEAMKAETHYSAEEAVAAGLADTVVSASAVTPPPAADDPAADDPAADPADDPASGADPAPAAAAASAGEPTASARAVEILGLCSVAGVTAQAAQKYVASRKSIDAIRAELARAAQPAPTPNPATSRAVQAREPFKLKDWHKKK